MAAEKSRDHDRLWIVGGVALLGVGVWANRDALITKLDAEVSSAARWLLVSLLGLGVVSAAVCARGVLDCQRWVHGHRTGPVPVIPVGAAVVAAGTAFLIIAWPSVGLGWALLVQAAVIAAGGWFGPVAARRWYVAAVFTERAEQVLGFGHPGSARVQASEWQRHSGTVTHYEATPARIEATTGPGWQGKPAELAELSRFAADVNWPGVGYNSSHEYRWVSDYHRRRVVGTLTLRGI